MFYMVVLGFEEDNLFRQTYTTGTRQVLRYNQRAENVKEKSKEQ